MPDHSQVHGSIFHWPKRKDRSQVHGEPRVYTDRSMIKGAPVQESNSPDEASGKIEMTLSKEQLQILKYVQNESQVRTLKATEFNEKDLNVLSAKGFLRILPNGQVEFRRAKRTEETEEPSSVPRKGPERVESMPAWQKQAKAEIGRDIRADRERKMREETTVREPAKRETAKREASGPKETKQIS